MESFFYILYMTVSSKIAILFSLLTISLGYSLYEKKKIEGYFELAQAPVLKVLPENLILKNFNTDEVIDLKKVAESGSGLMVHFWGTWCAPCEFEFPEFIEYAKKLKTYDVKVVLLAVNDDDLKIKKFIKRFGDLEDNIILVHDREGLSMKSFGVVKVPETFLFNKAGKNLTKFVGPQDWKLDSYLTRVMNLLSQ